MDRQTLVGKRIALLATNGFEDSEFTEPLRAVESAGAEVTIISEETGEFIGKNGSKVIAKKSVSDVNARNFDGLILPGGVANPDHLRTNNSAITFTRDFFKQHKPVAAICHAPWLLIEAGVVMGREMTSWPSLKTDLINAGAAWVDREVVVDDGLTTSRSPDDLDAFCARIVEEFAVGAHIKQTI